MIECAKFLSIIRLGYGVWPLSYTIKKYLLTRALSLHKTSLPLLFLNFFSREFSSSFPSCSASSSLGVIKSNAPISDFRNFRLLPKILKIFWKYWIYGFLISTNLTVYLVLNERLTFYHKEHAQVARCSCQINCWNSREKYTSCQF